MKLISIEPTPNPNSMKLNLDESLPKGAAITYRPEGKALYAEAIQKLLEIPGVLSLYRAGDFMSIQRSPSAGWEEILRRARAVLAGEGALVMEPGSKPEGEHWGEVRIAVQQFRRIPMLIKVSDDQQELRVALPARFGAAVQSAAPASPNMLLERRWIAQIPRYGNAQEVGDAVVTEIDAAYDQARLDALIRQAFEAAKDAPEVRGKPNPGDFESPDWKRRYAALEAAGDNAEFLPQLLRAMQDPQIPIRRLATVLVGLIGTPETVQPLCAALKDTAVAVRRSAGDALNDIADPSSILAMAETLTDANKLVRWRAARFLYELGGPEVLPALRQSQEDPEFEVRMQVRQAIERIEGGTAAQGPVWMRMTQDSASR
jgi:hypothetical protein